MRAQTLTSTEVPLVPDPGAPWLKHRCYYDHNTWEFDKNATAFAKELIVTQWTSAREGLQVLPLQNSLLGGRPSNGPKIVARQCVRELWEQVFTELDKYTTKAAIIGNPGIGKSRGLIYGLRLLLGGLSPERKTGAPQNKVIIYECRVDGEVFAFVPPGQDVRDGVVNDQCNVYRVLDGFRAEECAVLNFNLLDEHNQRTCSLNAKPCQCHCARHFSRRTSSKNNWRDASALH